MIAAYRRGVLELVPALSELVYRCTDCGAQRSACLHGVDAPALYHRIRCEAYAAGCLPPKLQRFVERFRRYGNPFGPDLEARLRRCVEQEGGVGRVELSSEEGSEPSDLVLFAGCAAAARRLEGVAAALFVLRRVAGARVRVAVFGGCCGAPLRAAGDESGFLRAVRSSVQAVGAARRVVVLDPVCVRAFDEWAPQLGQAIDFEVGHVLEWLIQHEARLRSLVVSPIEYEVAYHDPCHLGRRRGVYEAPRALIALACGGRRPVELLDHRQMAACSGAGGVYRKIWPEAARRIAERRLRQFGETGARRLATACPSATRHLGRGRPRGEVLGVIELLARALGWRPQGGGREGAMDGSFGFRNM